MWQRRQRTQKPLVPRIYSATISEGERYHLRQLLNKVKGPTSYEDLRTLDGVVHPTFKAAAIAHGLLQDDDEWDRCLQNSILNCMPGQICGLFAILLVYANLTDPKSLFEKFLPNMADDYIHSFHLLNRDYEPNDPVILAHVIDNISKYLSHHGKV